MKKIIALYISMIILIAFIAFLMYVKFDFLLPISFPRPLHIILEGTNSILMVLVFLVANFMYSKTKDERLIILAGGFLIGAIFNTIHIIKVQSFPYDLLSLTNIQNNPSLVYLLLGNLILPLAIYFALIHKPSEEKMKDFRLKTYSFYFLIFLVLTICPYLIMHFLPKLQYGINMLIHSFEFINYSLYIMLAFIVINIRQSSNITIFPRFTTGLVILGLGGLFYINPLLIPFNEILAHIVQAIGLVFILSGIKHFQTYAKFLKVKDELVAYMCLLIVVFYVVFVSIGSTLFHIIFPPISAYIFVEFILIFQFVVYLIANTVIQPITKIIEALNEYTPGKGYINIPVIRNDEIGQLTEKINTISMLSWHKILEVSKIAERNHSIISIFESMRRVSNQNVIKNSIVNELKTALNPDRIFIALYDSTNDSFYLDKYIDSLPSKALFTFCKEDTDEFDEEQEEEIMLKKLNEFVRNNLELCFTNINDYIVTNSLEKTQKEVLLKEYNIKSCCNIPIYYASHLLGCLVIQYTETFKEFDNTDLSYMKIMATQLGIVINNSGSTES